MSQFSQSALAALDNGNIADALRIARRHADAGDADTQFLLAQWHLVGRHLPRDLQMARSLLRNAVFGGSEDAALVEVALTANGSGGVADWPGALALLRQAAERFGGAARDDLDLVDSMAVDGQGNPASIAAPQLLGRGYLVRRWNQFLSPRECAHVAMSVSDLLAPSSVADPRTGQLIAHPVRNSSAAVIGPTRETLPIQAILRRIAAYTSTETSQGEPLTVLHYTNGQRYREHMDALPNEPNQRILTALIYLNSGYAGGETSFPEQGLSIVPGGGDLIVFDNVLPDGSPDRRSRHMGMPVNQGAKWAATRWIRGRPLDIWGAP